MHKHLIGLSGDLSSATLEQRQVHDLIAHGPRGSVPNPFLAMLDAPQMAAAIQEVGIAIRFRGRLPDEQRELAILATAGAVECGYEWNYHAPLGKQAGVTASGIAATLADQVPADIDQAISIIITLCREVALTGRTGENILRQALSLFGRSRVTELIGIAGYYRLLASFIFIGMRDVPFDLTILEGDASDT